VSSVCYLADGVYFDFSPSVTFSGKKKTHTTDYVYIYRVSQELRSLLRDLIPELILSQKRHIHMGVIGNDSGVMSF